MPTIKDELTSYIFLKDLRILISEYIPFGTNHIIAFNEELDCQRNVKEGLMTSFIDTDLEKATFEIKEELTKVKIDQYDPNDYVIFNASIVYEEEVEQQEEISVYVDAYGRVLYGTQLLEIDGDMRMSVDKLTRVTADLTLDTSRMINSMLSTYQRRLLDLVYFGTPEFRNKFTILLGKEIDPDKKAIEFHDGEAYENELNQVLSHGTHFHDLQNGDRFFYGLEGFILLSKNLEKYDPLVSILAFYSGFDIFQKNYFAKMFMLWDQVRDARYSIEHGDVDPNAIALAKNILTNVSGAVVLMNELLNFMRKSVENMNAEWDKLDKSIPEFKEIIEVIELEDFVGKALTRIDDAHLVVSGLTEEIGGINGLINSLTEKQMNRVNESLRDSISSLDEVTRGTERTGVALNVLQVVLSGSIAFNILSILVGGYSWDPLMTWVQNNIFIWTAISIGAFLGIGVGLWYTIKWLEKKNEPNFRVKTTINKPCKEGYKAFIEKQEIITRETQILDANYIESFMWEEDDEKWLGNEIKLKIRVDTTNGFILEAVVNIDKPNKITSKQVSAILIAYLKEEKVI
ncbi:MAG: hypothetical protein LUQ65_11865 [Candidatus Helarchaeota archaeon]|nr:hypothetical protein [Candidatus Helarchaeota archaeon]